ncbi:hypothetical protein AAC387_Pa10g0446 [Persea americana]
MILSALGLGPHGFVSGGWPASCPKTRHEQWVDKLPSAQILSFLTVIRVAQRRFCFSAWLAGLARERVTPSQEAIAHLSVRLGVTRSRARPASQAEKQNLRCATLMTVRKDNIWADGSLSTHCS